MFKRSISLAIFAIFASAAALTACEKKEVAFNTLETARSQAYENAVWNAEVYRNNNPRMVGLKVIGHGDDTQSGDCPQGSGWAKISIMGSKADGVRMTDGTVQIEKYVVYCSTVSAARSCFIEKDFLEKPFSKEYGHCASLNEVPFPIPKIAK